MRTFVLSGSFNTGKTTVMDEVKQRMNGKFHYAPDGGRAVLEDMGAQREKLTPQQQREFQLQVVEHYLRQEAEASNKRQDIISDSYMIETLAYGLPVLDEYNIKLIHALIAQRKDLLTVIKFPVLESIAMNNDGLRDTDLEYQKTIDQRINTVLHLHGIQPIQLQAKDIQGRVQEIMLHIAHDYIF